MDENIKDLLNQCWQLFEEGNYGEAVRRLTEMIRVSPKNSRLFYSRARIYHLAGEYGNAYEDYCRAIKLDPGVMDYWICCGSLMYGAYSSPQEGISDLEEAASLCPESSKPHLLLSNCYLMHGGEESAIMHAKKAIHLAPEDCRSYECLGLCYLDPDVKDYLLALEQYKTAYQLDPGSVTSWNGLYRAYEGLGMYEEAMVWVTKLLEVEPSARNYINLASLQLELDDPEGAIKNLQIAQKYELDEGSKLLLSGYMSQAEQKLQQEEEGGA